MDDVIKGALDRYQESESGSDFNRRDAHEDIKFARLSEQWPDHIRKQRELENRPCLTINKLPAFIRQVVNDARQNKPSIQVHPVDNGADEDTAEVIGGLIRSVERHSNADIAYDTAIDNAVSGGFGFFRIGIDYAHDDTFDTEAYIERIPNPLMVHWDVNSTAADASDWEYAFVSDFVTKEQFKKEYPDAEPASFEHSDYQDETAHWLVEEQIRLAEYWLREKSQRDLILFNSANGELPRPIREDQLPIMAKMAAEQAGLPTEGISDKELAQLYIQMMGLEEVRRRKVDYWTVKSMMINAHEVLSEEEWPGQHIPICPVWGDEVILDGRRHFRSMIRDAKDPQAMFNFWRSASTELVALAPRAPWVGPVGFVPDGHEQKWQSANTRSHAYLEYDPSAGGIPQRQPFAGVPAGVLQEAASASDDMKSIMSIYDSSLGAQSNETSGRAIMARQRESDVSNFHFIDNLSRAIRYAGRCLVEIIPSVYSARQSVRILGEDMAEKVVKLTQEDGGGMVKANGQRELYNLAVGKYDVTVSSGPSFSTQREETRETLIEIMRQVPDAAPFVGDVLLDHMDFVGADKVAKRLKALLPPEVRQAEEASENSDNPKLAAMQQQMQAKDQQMQQAQQQVMAEIEKLRAENEAIKQSKDAEMMRLKLDSESKMKEFELKEREMALKEFEAQKPEPDQSMKMATDIEMARERMAFDAEQADKNRELELIKLVMAKQGEGMDYEDAKAEAEREVSQIVFQRDERGNIISATKMDVESNVQ